MFGCIVAGRLIQTNLQQVDVNKYIFELPDAASINHIVVFLLGTIPFDPGYAATVHFLWPEKEWKPLGMLSNEKPSAIFRLRGSMVPALQSTTLSSSGFTYTTPRLLPSSTEGMSMDLNEMAAAANASAPVMATLGISIESIDVVEAQMKTLQSQFPTPSFTPSFDNLMSIAANVLKNLYNYITSFSTSNLPFGAQILGDPAGNQFFLPMKVFQEWYGNFTRKIKVDPGFLLKNE
ncbi:6198_t:CDS:2 [Paraglomus brasilianum]|uniref:6198_t:CDS:1 n=1 Tax=Paraglomus brasilianum TaxID=144538 RepID=A0A9N9FIB8_9GLOM|nr:6198_t:CDS:2 [Paraglomus brasilianum]